MTATGTSSSSFVKVPDPVDIHVGQRLRMRRTMLGVSQTQLAHGLGISFQQVQKYENGFNRISASRLFDTALLLGMPVKFFFEDMDPSLISTRKSSSIDIQGEGQGKTATVHEEKDPLARNETLRLVNAFWSLSTEDLREHVLGLVEAASKSR